MKGLNEDITNLPKIKDASLPLYEGIVDRRLRVLMAVIIGSDAWPG